MRRRSVFLACLLAFVVGSAAGCGGSGSSLTDPAEILTKSVEAMQKATSVHLEADVDGTMNLDLLGTGTASDLALTGTALTGDIDFESSDVRLDLEVPAMLGMTAELVAVDGETYTKTSFTGEKFTKSAAGDSDLPVDPSDPAASLVRLAEWLARPEVDPKKLADASCGMKSCYQVEIDLTAEDLIALMPDVEAFGAPIGEATAVLTALIDKETLLPASLDVTLASAELGELIVSLDLMDWNSALDVAAPPADQVEP